VLRYDGQSGDFIDAFVSFRSGGLDLPSFLLFTEGIANNTNNSSGGACSVTTISGKEGFATVIYIFLPLLFIVLRRLIKRKGRDFFPKLSNSDLESV